MDEQQDVYNMVALDIDLIEAVGTGKMTLDAGQREQSRRDAYVSCVPWAHVPTKPKPVTLTPVAEPAPAQSRPKFKRIARCTLVTP
jgi:hypothetical protein